MDNQTKQTTNWRRIILALLFVPMVPPFYAMLFFAEPWSLPIGVSLSYPSMLLFGLPMFLLLRSRDWLAWWCVILAGALCSLPALLLYWWLGQPPHLEAFNLLNACELVAWGAFAGLCFWLLGISGESTVTFRTLLDLG